MTKKKSMALNYFGEIGSSNKNNRVASNLPFLADIMPAVSSRRRFFNIENGSAVDESREIIFPTAKKPRTKSPVPSSKLGLRSQSRKPLGSVSSLVLNTSQSNSSTAPANVSLPHKTMNDDPMVVSAREIKRSRSCGRDSETSTALLPSVTPTPEPTKPSAPVKDDRFRVFYDRCDDAWGKGREGAKGFFLGTAVSVSRPRKTSNGTSTYKIVIKFDTGGTSSFDYPSDPTVERLVPSLDGPNQLMSEITGEFACDLRPSHLDEGDLVFVNYQNRGSRYRGRIAGIQGERCDVLYDDKELELNVPINDGTVWLVEDGIQYRHWLDGLQVKFPVGTNRKTLCTIRVPEEEGVLELVHPNGKTEKQKYYPVVQALFLDAKQNCNTVYDFNNPSNLTQATEVEVPQLSGKIGRRKQGTKSHRNSGGVGDNDDPLLCHPNDFVSAEWESNASEDEEANWEETTPFRDMSNSVQRSFWKALNTSDGHVGADLLFKVTSFHSKVANDALCKDLMELLWKGPLYRNNQFPDCIRLELATNYFDLLKKTNGMGHRLAKSLPQSFIKDFLEQVESPAVIYCVAGDESRITSAALQRVGQTLAVKNSGAAMLSFLLACHLKGYQQFGKSSNPDCASKMTMKRDMAAFGEELRSRQLTRQILESGSTQSLKLAVKATFSILIFYGHYLSNDFVFPHNPNPETDSDQVPPHASPCDQSFAATEVRRLLKSMGRIVSYLAWIYSIEQGESIYEARFLIRDAVDGLLTASTFDPSIFLKGSKDEGNLNRHWRDMKLRFALSLDKRISGNLGRYTAEMFELTLKYF